METYRSNFERVGSAREARKTDPGNDGERRSSTQRQLPAMQRLCDSESSPKARSDTGRAQRLLGRTRVFALRRNLNPSGPTCCLGRCSRDADELPVASFVAEVDGDRSLVCMVKSDAATNIGSIGDRLERIWQRRVFGGGHVFLLLCFVVPHKPAELIVAGRRKAILDCQIVKRQMIIGNSKSFQRQHLTEPGSANRVAPGFEHTGDVVHNLRIVKVSFFDDGADLFVAECHHALGSPIPIEWSHLHKRWVGIIRLPGKRIESGGGEIADGFHFFRIVNRLPIGGCQPEGVDSAPRDRKNYVFVPVARIFGNITVASKRIPKVQQVMHYSGTVLLSLIRVQAVLTFGIRMVDPGKEDFEPSQVAALLVWHKIVRIVRTNARVAERSRNLGRKRETGHEPKTAVWFPGDSLENLSQLDSCQATVFPVRRFHRRFFGKAKLLGAAFPK